MTSDATAIAQGGATALGGVPIQEAMLAFAPDFGWLILAFHVIIKIKYTVAVATLASGSDTPSLRESANQSVRR
jgi:hypothetical protein